jgi:hypothetical protein
MKGVVVVVFIVVSLAVLCFTGAAESPKADAVFEPTDAYDARDVGGWRVMVNKRFAADEPAQCEELLTLLRVQLYQVARVVPAAAVGKLKKVTIWVERDEPHHECMAYHPDAGWLRDNGMNPDKARCVEIADAANFLAWAKDQPWMVLHELAHAYHHQFLPDGFDNRDLRTAWHRATGEQKRYDAVLHINGRTVRAYAANNPMEFFAEASEALFGTNDFFPFVRAELASHDPETHDVVRRLWGVE